jgi:hypothetical protein
MSDTSIVQSDTSNEYDYELEGGTFRRNGNCWTRIGANVCVCILTLSTIFLLVALLYTLSRQQATGKRGKGSSGGFFDMFNVFGDSSDPDGIYDNDFDPNAYIDY